MSPEESRAEGGPYHQLLDAAPDAMIVVGRDGRIRFANAQSERLFGHSRSDLLDMHLHDLIPERFRASHVGHLMRFFSRPEFRPMGSGLALFGLTKGAIEVPIEVSLSPIQWAGEWVVCAAIRDITMRKRIEAAAQMSAARLSSAIETMHDAFAIFDAADRLVLCNAVYRQLVGEEPSDPLAGKSYEQLLDRWLPALAFPTDEERRHFRAARLAGRLEPQSTFDVRTRDGRSLRVLDRRTAEGGIVKTVWDLTEDVRLAGELREAQALAESASAAKTEFLSSMSHELRTPLNAILGFAQLLRRDRKEPLSARHAERVDQILRGGEHLLRLIDDILDLSRIEAGRLSISAEPVNATEVIAEVKRTLDPMAARAALEIEFVPPPAGLPYVTADRTRFAQIVMNFVSNAIKYNRPGGKVSLLVSNPTSQVVRVTVVDTGVGIAEDKQDKLFLPFQRAGQEAGPIEGTGIGLVITKRLAHLMGGDVGFRSRQGVGSEFWVDLPAHPGSALPATKPSAAPSAGPDAERAAPHRLVLYIEDNQANATFMRDVLRDFEGVELVLAPTAEMGIELARTHLPDVIILDINLPGMNGLEALGSLRKDPATAKLPVIALTAAASERDKKRGAEAGFHRYLTKPVQVDELLNALDPFLSAPST